MGSAFKAHLPDGSSSRLGWFVWLGVGLFAGWWAFQMGFLSALLGEFARQSAGDFGKLAGQAASFIVSTGVMALFTVLVALVATFAQRRLLMPPVTWIAAGFVPVAGLVISIPAQLEGWSVLPLLVEVASSILIAWAWVQLRESRRPAVDESDG